MRRWGAEPRPYSLFASRASPVNSYGGYGVSGLGGLGVAAVRIDRRSELTADDDI